MSAGIFLKILLAEGLDVIQESNWPTHNRNHKGPWGPVNGVMIHHTVTEGTAATVRICRDGHADLPGPLCHGVIAKDGRVHLVGYGRTNHAGLGDGDVLAAVIAERALPPDNEADTDGNRHFFGFECENLGDGKDPWPAAQLDAIERAAAAICRHYGWSARSVIGHREWQPGKIDPRGFEMDNLRDRVDARLAHPASWSPGSPMSEEDDMTPEQAKQLKELHALLTPYAGWNYKGQGEAHDAHSYLVGTDARTKKILTAVAAVRPGAPTDAQMQQLAATLAASPDLAAAIAEQVAQKLADRLES